MYRKHERTCRHGNVAVIIALALVVLLAAAAVAIDLGYARVVREQLKNASEAAAHAASQQLDGTDDGVAAARAAAVAAAAANMAGGRAVDLDDNPANLESWDVVMGTWNEDAGTFTPTEEASAVNSVQVRARIPDLGLFFAPVAVGRNEMAVSAETRAMAMTGGASAVDCFIPLAFAQCEVDRLGAAGMQDLTLKLNPPGVDNVGWARPNGTPNANWSRDQMNDCQASGTASVGDPVGLQNGVVSSAMSALATRVSTSSTRWDTTKWGAMPTRSVKSSISKADYGKTYEGPVMVFDGGGTYCTGSGGSFNQSAPITAFVWGAIYDVENSGSSSSRTIKMRLDPMTDHDIGTEDGGPDYGVIAHSPPRTVR
jgi:Flp pilus assembly protein TadG